MQVNTFCRCIHLCLPGEMKAGYLVLEALFFYQMFIDSAPK